MAISVIVWLLILGIIIGGIGRRLQGGLIDRIFYGKKTEWVVIDGVLRLPDGVSAREKDGSFGTTKARLVYSGMLTILYISVLLYRDLSFNTLTYINVLLCFIICFAGQTVGAFNSLNAGFVMTNSLTPPYWTFSKSKAVKNYIGLTMMGFGYLAFPLIMLTYMTIFTNNYLYLLGYIAPFLWYFGYYFAHKYPTHINWLETQYDDPNPTGELLTGALFGIMVVISGIVIVL